MRIVMILVLLAAIGGCTRLSMDSNLILEPEEFMDLFPIVYLSRTTNTSSKIWT